MEGERNGWLHNLERYLARIGEETPNDISRREKEMVERVILVVSHLFEDLKPLEGQKTVREHRKNFSDLLIRWGVMDVPAPYGKDHNREEQAAIEAFVKCLDELDRSTGLMPDESIDAGGFLAKLLTLIKETEIPVNSDPSGVAVLGIRECVHEHFPVLFPCRSCRRRDAQAHDPPALHEHP